MNRGPRVIALGDSISVGVGDATAAADQHAAGWAAHLAQLAGASTFINLSRNGARTRNVVTEQLPQALDLMPDVATLVVGGNDVLRSDFSAYEVAANLSIAVTALRDCGCSVVLAKLPAIGLFELMPPAVKRVMRARVAAVNAAVDAVVVAARPRTVEQVGDSRRGTRGRRALKGTVVVVDVDTVTRDLGRTAWHSDRVHPSAEAHRRLAAIAAIALARGGVLDIPGVAPDIEVRPGAAPVPPPGPEVVEALTATLPPTPPPPSLGARALWLVVAGLPWCVRRGRDFVPGLVRAVVDELRGRAETTSLASLSTLPTLPTSDSDTPRTA